MNNKSIPLTPEEKTILDRIDDIDNVSDVVFTSGMSLEEIQHTVFKLAGCSDEEIKAILKDLDSD